MWFKNYRIRRAARQQFDGELRVIKLNSECIALSAQDTEEGEALATYCLPIFTAELSGSQARAIDAGRRAHLPEDEINSRIQSAKNEGLLKISKRNTGKERG